MESHNIALSLVRLANRWEAARIEFTFPGQSVRVQILGVGDRREWLESFVAGEDDLRSVLPREVVLAASGEAGGRAVRVNAEGAEWGDASLPANTLLLQFEADGEEVARALEISVASDRTEVVVEERVLEAFSGGEGLSLGLWALLSEEGRISLGRSFSSLGPDGVSRRELTFGRFRTGLLGDSAGNKSRAQAVVSFDYLDTPAPSRVIWLENGVQTARGQLGWEPERLQATVFRQGPPETDAEERLLDDLTRALQAMVAEYNSYTPRVERGTVGCWSTLALSAVALAGLVAPFTGSALAAMGGAVLAVSLIVGEFQFRHRERYAVGRSLATLARILEKKKGKSLLETRSGP